MYLCGRSLVQNDGSAATMMAMKRGADRARAGGGGRSGQVAGREGSWCPECWWAPPLSSRPRSRAHCRQRGGQRSGRRRSVAARVLTHTAGRRGGGSGQGAAQTGQRRYEPSGLQAFMCTTSCPPHKTWDRVTGCSVHRQTGTRWTGVTGKETKWQSLAVAP